MDNWTPKLQFGSGTMDREKLVRDVIFHLFWTQTIDWDIKPFMTEENIRIANTAINIARQQLPREKLFDPDAIYQRCVLLFRLPGAFYFYKHWC